MNFTFLLQADDEVEFVPTQVVYVARNPKDVIVSYFHHHRLFKLQDCTTDIEKFAEYFMKDECKKELILLRRVITRFGYVF